MNIGDKKLIIANTEDITSFHIFEVDDVLEISLTENVFVFTVNNSYIRYAYNCIPIKNIQDIKFSKN